VALIERLRFWLRRLALLSPDDEWQAKLIRCDRWLRRALAPLPHVQERYDWWHDPNTGNPIPWRNVAFWPSGEFDPLHSPPADMVAEMRRRLSPGPWQPSPALHHLDRTGLKISQARSSQ
jgi:hypothetical protein